MKIDMSLVRSETTKLVAENDEEMAMSYAGSSSSGSSHKRFVSTSSSGLSELSPMELSSSLSKRVKTMSNGLSSSNNSPRSSPCSTSAASPPHSSSNSTTTTTSTNPTTISSVQNSPLPQMSAANANSLLSFLFTTAAAAATTANNASSSNHLHSNNHSNSQTPTSSLLSKSLECVDSSLTYVDTTSGEGSSGEQIKLTANRFALNMASNMRAYVQAHVPPDTLLKFANNADVTLIAHKLLLYNASPFFRRKYNEVTQQNGIYIIKLDANFCANSVQTCLEYIYSMGLGDLELGAPNSLGSLKHTAQCLELTDLARLVELLIDREPPPSLLQSHQNSVNNNHHQVAQQQLSQIYTNLMIEQLLKKLCNTNTTNNDQQQQQQQQQQSNENKTLATTKTTSISDEINNTRFMSLFNRSRIDLSRFESDFELDTISRDLVIKEKYVYPSQDLSPHFLDACFENSVLINLDRTNETDQSQISNEFQRHALIIFSINLDTSSATPSSSASATPTTSTSPVGCGGQQPNPTSTSPPTTSHSTNNSTHQNHHHHHSSTSTTISPTSSSSSPPSSSSSTSVESRAFKLQNFVIKSRLNFTELSLLKEDISRLFEQFLNQVLVKSLNISGSSSNSHQNYYRCVVNRVCYLKKPSNCKTIRVETIKSSTDCLRAIVEYSRVNESTRELPYVFLTTHSSVYVA